MQTETASKGGPSEEIRTLPLHIRRRAAGFARPRLAPSPAAGAWLRGAEASPRRRLLGPGVAAPLPGARRGRAGGQALLARAGAVPPGAGGPERAALSHRQVPLH